MTTPIQLDFNQAPADIVAIMDETKSKATVHKQQQRRYRSLPWLLAVSGLAMFGLDYFVGYNFYTCSILGVVLLLSAYLTHVFLRRRTAMPYFGKQYDLARELLYILRDDIAPKRTMIGQLDLSGAEQESKQYRKKRSRSGRPIAYYRDEWLQLKGKLYDGNVLRLSLITKEKVREGFYKRSRVSGKRKWKSGSSQTSYLATIALSANPEFFTVPPVDLQGQPVPDSRLTVITSTVGQGRISIKLAADRALEPWDVLNALQYAYQFLERKGPKTSLD